MRVLEGKLILNGPEFFIGAKDTPEHIARKGNIRRLKWMSTKFVLLWDDRDKRGWLINGTTALLHIVRAFLSHAKEDNFKSAFQLNDEDLQEAKVPFTADSAIAVLLNPVNRRLKLYDEDEGDDDEYLLKTQIDHFYNILEQLIEYQADIAGHDGSKLRNSPRKFLEGWDFEDMAKECPTIYPRVATIGDAGKGWVDFIRAIHAVTIVGRGFGDIIRPTGRDHCDSWATLPTKRYYIASCVSDLDRLFKEAGSHQDGHDLLCDNLIYHAPVSAYLPCQCRVTPGRKHCEPVRTLIPSAMSTVIPFRKSLTKTQEPGAVILGYSSHFPLIWGDTGLPQQGELTETEPLPKAIEEDVDSGFGSNTTVSEIEDHSFFQIKSETESSFKPEELQSPAARKAMPNVTIAIEQKIYTRNRYTVGIICPLPKELMAVRALFDSRHPNLNTISGDSNQYALGIMEGHWVVAACLPFGEYGTNAAASVASNMICNFPSIRFCLLVGIGGGVPSEKRDIRLGDVVVSQPTGTNSGVLQYDLGKEEDGNHFRLVGSLQRPPRVLTTAIGSLHSDPEPLAGRLEESLSKVIDCLPTYKHSGQELDVPAQATCASCNSWQWLLGSCSHIRQRLPRTTTIPTIHYGLIASGNRVIKDEKFRNRLAREHDILCFEMEAAGVINTVDCLVIRGICDYCDAQKNNVWQEYAAAAAAAYAKLLIGVVAKVEQPGNAS
jgi:nucleoside phosphorylase